MGVKKGLGRGFDSLIPTDVLDESFDPTAKQDEQMSDLRHIKIDQIHADPQQPRRTFDGAALAELEASIRVHGVLQPIVVAPDKDGFMIVAGERRWRASKRAGRQTIPAIVRTLTDQHRLELSLIENIQRHDLNPLETATAFLKLRDQFNLSLEEISQQVGGRSVSAISNSIRLLRLPGPVQQALLERTIREGQARPLIGCDEAAVTHILPTLIKEQWSARQVEQWVTAQKHADGQAHAKRPAARPLAAVHAKKAAALTSQLGTPVKVRANTKGAGQIVIAFSDDEEFQRLTSLLDR